MDPKATGALQKARQERAKGQYQKALKRIDDAIAKFGEAEPLSLEAIATALEGGEVIKAIQYGKRAMKVHRNSERAVLEIFTDTVRDGGDPAIVKYLLETYLQWSRFDDARELLESQPERLMRELLQRTRTKNKTLRSAIRGGVAVSQELLVNTSCEIMLSLRLEMLQDAAETAVELVDRDDKLADRFSRLFSPLGKQYTDSGWIRYANACCLATDGNFDEAAALFIQAARLDPDAGNVSLDRIRHIEKRVAPQPESIRLALVAILIGDRSYDRAAELLNEWLDADTERWTRIPQLLGDRVSEFAADHDLTFMHFNSLLRTEGMVEAVKAAERISQDDAGRARLYSVLEPRYREQDLHPDLRFLFGSIALQEGYTDDAVKALEAHAASSGAAAQTVIRFLESYRNDSRVAGLIERVGTTIATPQSGASSSSDTSGFELQEAADFAAPKPAPGASFRDELDLQPVSPKPFANQGLGNRQEFSLDEIDQDIAVTGESAPAAPAMRERELTFDDEDHSAASAEPTWDRESHVHNVADQLSVSGARTFFHIDDHVEPEPAPATPVTPVTPVAPVAPVAPVKEPEPEVPSDNELISNVDEVLEGAEDPARESVVEAAAPDEVNTDDVAVDETAAAPNEVTIDDAVVDETVAAPDFDPDLDDDIELVLAAPDDEHVAQRNDEPETHEGLSTATDERDDIKHTEPTTEDSAVPELAADAPFDEQFQRYLDGGLSAAHAIDLAEMASETGRFDELRELLYCETDDEQLGIRKQLLAAEYHLGNDQPRLALEVIAAVPRTSLDKGRNKTLSLLTAECHRALQNFEAANRVYNDLMREHPYAEDISALAKANYADFLKSQCGSAAVLSKTTSLNLD